MLITESSKPSFIAFASIVWHTNTMSAWFSTVSNHWHMKLMTNFNFTMISIKSIWASAFINTITSSTVHAWDYTFGWKFSLDFSSIIHKNERKRDALHQNHIHTKFTLWTIKSSCTLAFILLYTFAAIQTLWFTDACRWNNFFVCKKMYDSSWYTK